MVVIGRDAFSKTDSRHITTKSGHEIHLTEPELVITAIKEVLNAVRTGQSLKK